jgi:putative restriction endonuclease
VKQPLLQPHRFYVGVTDDRWFQFLRNEPLLEEVNFWSPGGRVIVAERGTPFLFKLKSPANAIGGLGFVSFVQRMPIKDAWEFFRRENGAGTLDGLRQRIAENRPSKTATLDDIIGCFILSQPVFFATPIAQPEDWPKNLQGGKYYSLSEPVAQRIWRDLSIALAGNRSPAMVSAFGGYGQPSLQPTRLGQGAFRKLVLDAYGRRCAISGEHTVPVLEASHIMPFAEVGKHEVTNGLALRSDIHTLFDQGYVTVTPGYRFLVSERLREDFDNGEIYYQYSRERQTILLPEDCANFPNREHLDWHKSTIFKR